MGSAQELIGKEAEALAWLFCVMRRETLKANIGRPDGFAIEHRISGDLILLTADQFLDLVNVTFANELEPYPRMWRSWRRGCRAYLKTFRHLAMPGGRIDRRSAENYVADKT